MVCRDEHFLTILEQLFRRFVNIHPVLRCNIILLKVTLKVESSFITSAEPLHISSYIFGLITVVT